MIKVVTIVGARPQFVKAAAVSRVIAERFANQVQEVMLHTGQHYDESLSKVFFEELEIPAPAHNLGISGSSHGRMTGRMLEGIEGILLKERPDWVLVYGDTNSTLAGALAASKLHIPLAHVEAGLRSFNMRMPEEINRVLTDRVSTLLFCPTQTAVENLAQEGMRRGIFNVGDVMLDAALFYRDRVNAKKTLSRFAVSTGQYALATCHRAENTDDCARLKEILKGLSNLSHRLPVLLPLHPRTQKLISDYGLSELTASLTLLEPLPFLDMVALEQSASLILTDSGGVQKEAFFYGVPCITMRDQTEWVETVDSGWNRLVGANADLIGKAVDHVLAKSESRKPIYPYGKGDAAEKIISHLMGSAVGELAH